MGSGRSLACPLLYLSGSGMALPVAAEEMRELELLLLAPVPSGHSPPPADPLLIRPSAPSPIGHQISGSGGTRAGLAPTPPPLGPRGLSAALTLAWGLLPSGGSTWEMPSVMPSVRPQEGQPILCHWPGCP